MATAGRFIATGLCLWAAGCATAPATLDGTWVGAFDRTSTTRWTLRVTIASHGDSLSGDAAVTSLSFHEAYFLRGVRRGDSVSLRLRPVEDADINFAGALRGERLGGRLWFNALTDSTYVIEFVKP